MRREMEVPQDDYKAVELYRKGCNGGNALGCTHLGWMYQYRKRYRTKDL